MDASLKGAVVLVGLAVTHLAANAQVMPPCRLDSASASLVAQTVERAAQAYRTLGKSLPFDTITVNRPLGPGVDHSLAVYVISDAAVEGVNASGCSSRQAAKDEPLDKLSVRGGCVVVATGKPELRCSSKADRKSTRLNSSHFQVSRMPSSA